MCVAKLAEFGIADQRIHGCFGEKIWEQTLSPHRVISGVWQIVAWADGAAVDKGTSQQAKTKKHELAEIGEELL